MDDGAGLDKVRLPLLQRERSFSPDNYRIITELEDSCYSRNPVVCETRRNSIAADGVRRIYPMAF